MSYGVECYDGTSRTVFTSTGYSPCLIDTFTTVLNTNGSKTYSSYAGCSIDVQAAPTSYGNLPLNFSVDYALGYPRVNWNATPPAYSGLNCSPYIVRIFVLTPPAIAAGSFGMSILNNNNELINFIDTDNMHFVGQGTFSSQTAIASTGPQTYRLNYTISSPNGVPLVFIENLSGQSTSLTEITGTAPSFTLTITANTGSIPRVFCFANISASTPAQRYGIAVYNSSGIIKLDTTARPLTCPAFLTSATPAYTVGISGSYYYASGAIGISATGTVPTVSATMCCSPQAWTWEIQNVASSYRYIGYTVLGVYRSGSSFVNNWIQVNPTGGPFAYKTIYPLYYSNSITYRIYMIDVATYV
jgi:hypothetical protein